MNEIQREADLFILNITNNIPHPNPSCFTRSPKARFDTAAQEPPIHHLVFYTKTILSYWREETARYSRDPRTNIKTIETTLPQQF